MMGMLADLVPFIELAPKWELLVLVVIVLVVGAIAGGDPGDEDPIDPTEFDHEGWNRWP